MRKMTGKEFSAQTEFFDNMAQTNWLKGLHHKLKENSGAWTDKDVLDIGCGTGRLLLTGADEAASITGIDLSKEMVQKARKLSNTQPMKASSKFIVGDAYSLPFADQTFDISISTLVMFLLPEPEKGIKEMARVTKDNGVSVLLNPAHKMNPESAAAFAYSHSFQGFEKESFLRWASVAPRRHRFKQAALEKLLLENGAKKVEQEVTFDGLALLTTVKWKERACF